ncbi:hypothetical protein [Solicola gregarius]|uniref:Uncharacterized protein n=1 Tax=Solicola gregarius TaxID=2908642 RepID=A0AA46TIW5_9ACTN|nr:hypothetical protein [Solicola gregarius]UYM06172.1 hypothetical protein L0C25_03605 [Solicola gregarius]
MHGLTVRWSLANAPADTLDRLGAYVRDSSHERFSGMDGLRFKTWRARDGEWFEGCYVFESDAARAAFQASFTASAADSPGSAIVGESPIAIEECTIVAVAEGGDGFAPSAAYER